MVFSNMHDLDVSRSDFSSGHVETTTSQAFSPWDCSHVSVHDASKQVEVQP